MTFQMIEQQKASRLYLPEYKMIDCSVELKKAVLKY